MELLESSYLPSNLNLQHKNIKKTLTLRTGLQENNHHTKREDRRIKIQSQSIVILFVVAVCWYKFSTSHSIHTNPKDAPLVVI